MIDEHTCRFSTRDTIYCNEAIRRSKGCDRCGWNPEVEEARIEELHRRLRDEDYGETEGNH